MKPFDELGVDGQRRRIRLLAQDVAAAFGLSPDRTRVRRAAESFNTIFKVETDGHVCALRVGPVERIHLEGTEVVEARWMRELADGGISVPRVYECLAGGPVVRHARSGVPGERVCMMFGWVRGVPLSGRMGAEAARSMGRLAALLHEAAPAAEVPNEPPSIADRVLHWQVENRLAELVEAGSMLEEALARAQEVLDAIWCETPQRPQLLHGDLTPDNVLAGAKGLVVIDFQDVVWGFDIQDLAITLASFGRFSMAAELRNGFRDGYVDVRPWPELDEQTFAALTAARRLHQINLSLTLRRPELTQVIERGCQQIADWMK